MQDENAKQYLEIIINSTNHLSLVIEDALDLSRVENNKFDINLGEVKIRDLLKEVKNIMSFQIELKKLYLNIEIDDNVPKIIVIDSKRYK